MEYEAEKRDVFQLAVRFVNLFTFGPAMLELFRQFLVLFLFSAQLALLTPSECCEVVRTFHVITCGSGVRLVLYRDGNQLRSR